MSDIPETARQIAGLFALPGEIESCEAYGCGHVNHTFRVHCRGRAEDYVLQRISAVAFHHPEQVMENVVRVTAHLQRAVAARGGDPARETLTLIPLKDGGCCTYDREGVCWRMYRFIPDTVTYQLPDTPEVLRQAGAAFGSFQAMLADFPAGELYETIPRFHDTPHRLADFRRALREDSAGRAQTCGGEVEAILSRADRAGELMDAGLPLRVTHNDTKLNNVLMDSATGRGLCVVDLDTVMPGLAAWDFGDAVRFGANTALEGERDLSKVRFSLPMYRAWAEGYLEQAGSMLTPEELDSLPTGCWMMTYELASRFLADYLSGDVYFHIELPDDNLARARCQLALLADMERHGDEMLQVIHELTGRV